MFWMIEAFICKKTWMKTLKTPGIWIMIIILAAMFISSRAYGYDCGDYIQGMGGKINPKYIAYVKKIHNHSEIADGANWEYQSYVIMQNGHPVLYTQSHNESIIDSHISDLVNMLNRCKEDTP